MLKLVAMETLQSVVTEVEYVEFRQIGERVLSQRFQSIVEKAELFQIFELAKTLTGQLAQPVISQDEFPERFEHPEALGLYAFDEIVLQVESNQAAQTSQRVNGQGG